MASTRSTLLPAETAIALIESVVAKHRTRPEIIFWKAFNAGVLLSMGGLLNEVVSGGSPGTAAANPGLVKIIGGFVFPAGITMIFLGNQELLTSNMLTFPMAIAKGAVPWWSLPYNWIIVTFGNLVGSLFFAALIVKYSGIMSADPFATYAREFAIGKTVIPAWHQIFLRGIGCNWLVSVATWHCASAKDTVSKIYGIWFPIWIFVACSFDHVIANMFYMPLGIMMGAPFSTVYYIRKSLIPTYLGNIIGAAFVGLPYIWFYLKGYRYAETETARNLEQGEGNGSTTTASKDNITNLHGITSLKREA